MQETFAQRLVRFRRRRGLSAADVAQRVGVAESTYRDWEAGRAIRGEPYVRLAEALDVGLSQLLLGEASEYKEVLDALDQIEKLLRKIRLHL